MGHPFRPVKKWPVRLASYFMQMRFEASDLKLYLSTSLFYILIPEVVSQHVQIEIRRFSQSCGIVLR